MSQTCSRFGATCTATVFRCAQILYKLNHSSKRSPVRKHYIFNNYSIVIFINRKRTSPKNRYFTDIDYITGKLIYFRFVYEGRPRFWSVVAWNHFEYLSNRAKFEAGQCFPITELRVSPIRFSIMTINNILILSVRRTNMMGKGVL